MKKGKGKEDESNRTLKHSGKDWTYAVSSAFVQGTTKELREQGIRIHNLTWSARMLYIYLRSYVGPNCAAPYPGLKRISTDLGINESTIKKYRRELEEAGYLVREQLRDPRDPGRFFTNSYLLVDEPAPSVKLSPAINPTTDGFSPAVNSPTKRYQDTRKEGPGQNCEAEIKTSSNSVPPSASRAGAAATGVPSERAGATAPGTPGAATKRFIESYRYWTEVVGESATVVPRESAALKEFFTDNPKMTPRELTAIMLAAWLMTPLQKEDEGLEPFWYCLNKSRRIKSFLEFLPNIQDEVNWQSAEEHVEKIYEVAEKRFVEKGEKPARSS